MVLVSLHLGFAAAPGFAHNWVTRLQQGRCGALLVLLSPYLASKTAHRAAQGRVWVFSPKTNSPLPLKGEGRGIAFLGFVGGLRWCHSLPGFQNRTQGRTGAGLVSACWLAILRKIAFRNPV